MPGLSEATVYVIEKSKQSVTEGRFESGILWLINGLQKTPGEQELIKVLVNMILEEADDPSDEALKQLSWLSTFLRNHCTHVDMNNFEMMLLSIEKVDKHIDALKSGENDKSSDQTNLLNDEDSRYLQDIKNKLKDHGAKNCPLPSEGALDNELRQLDRILTFIDSDQDSSETAIIEELTTMYKRMQSCLSVRELIKRTKDLLEGLNNLGGKENGDLAIYNIQNADRLLSQAAVFNRDLDESWRLLLQQELVLLKQSDQKRVESIVEDKKNEITKKLESLSSSNTRAIQKITDIQIEYFTWKSAHPEAMGAKQTIKIEKEISTKLKELTVQRSKAYNKWAMSIIKDALKNRDEDHSKKKIIQILDEELGTIDLQHLTHEVSRMYTEVFEFLFSKLKRAKKADNFDDSKGKLKALEAMFNRDKKSLADF